MRSPIPPCLETPRLILRGWLPRDLEPHAEMSADPEVMRYIGEGNVHDQGQSWREVAMHIGHWALRGYGQWAIEWTWSNLDAPELISLIQPDNTVSMRVAERLGMKPLRESTVKGQPVVVFGLERP